MNKNQLREHSSFRDNSGYVFYQNNQIYRTISTNYRENFDALHQSGLYQVLVDKKYIVPYTIESDMDMFDIKNCYKIIRPQAIPFISYPYEWSFDQLKDAALLTLKIQLISIKYGFVLKDASAFNVQFIGCKPIFIDTSSFERYRLNEPWYAYKQFCEHFLCPLMLKVHHFGELQKITAVSLNGISLKFTSKSLPFKTRLQLFSLMHIHWHAKAEKANEGIRKVDSKRLQISKIRLINLVKNLKNGITKLEHKNNTNWTDYYCNCSYDDANFIEKKDFIHRCLEKIKPIQVFDAGCNEGVFSEIASQYASQVIACDFDSEVVGRLYKKNKADNKLLPLVIDITNPSSSVGWDNNERKSFKQRLGDNNTTFALALIHHLCIGNNIPFQYLSSFFKTFSSYLIIEFVPKEDIQVKRLLVTKKDIFDSYLLEYFVAAFSVDFEICQEVKLSNSGRILFLMKRNEN